MKQTKIIATLGPSCSEREVFEQLVDNGLNCARLNFSHGDHEFHGENIKMIREVNKDKDTNVGILLDTKGPEIRTNDFVNGEEYLEKGDFVYVSMKEVAGTKERFSITYPELINDVNVGGTILVDDGLIELEIVEKLKDELKCKILNSGMIKNKKGINVPNCQLGINFISEKDHNDIKFGADQDVDFIAASFVRRKQDVLDIKKLLKKFGNENILILAKIENQEGLDNVEEILEVADGIMVARGDLGVEIPLEKVPLAQKQIIKLCNRKGKIAITATHLLDSMQRNPRPTRAETTDVANAILDGSDAIMLSGETAAGEYPVESVKVMSTIAQYVEKDEFDYIEMLNRQSKSVSNDISGAIAISVASSALKLNSKAIVASTATGYTARHISRFRLPIPVIATTPESKTCTQLSLSWGVHPILVSFVSEPNEIIKIAKTIVGNYCEIEKGDTYILTAGIPTLKTKHTNFMKIEMYGDHDE